MAKKILGDDPFRPSTGEPAKAGKANAKTGKKAKRAPSRKTEAPRATRAAVRTEPKSTKARRTDSATDSVTATDSATAAVAATHALSTRPTRDRGYDEPPVDAAPNSWRWWRYRQLQLARAEDASWLARTEGPSASRPDRFGRDPVLAGRAEPLVDVIYRSWMHVSARGLGHVPESGRAILVARRRRATHGGLRGAALAQLSRLGLDGMFHASLDAALISHAIRTEHVAHREVRPLVRSARLYMPVLGSLLRRLGGVPSELHDIARLLDDERLALTFVDDGATRRRGDELELSTIICLALVTGAPIVPVSIVSSAGDRAFFRGPALTALAFGTPLFPGTEFGPDGAEDAALVARLAAELDARIS